MDGCDRALDNVFCERLWRSVKYENIYLNLYDTVRQLHAGLTAYFDFYNHERPASKSRLSPAGGRALPALFRAGRIRLNATYFSHFVD